MFPKLLLPPVLVQPLTLFPGCTGQQHSCLEYNLLWWFTSIITALPTLSTARAQGDNYKHSCQGTPTRDSHLWARVQPLSLINLCNQWSLQDDCICFIARIFQLPKNSSPLVAAWGSRTTRWFTPHDASAEKHDLLRTLQQQFALCWILNI